jgi:hypothetical protein
MLAASQQALFTVMLIVIHCYENVSYDGEIFKAAMEL